MCWTCDRQPLPFRRKFQTLYHQSTHPNPLHCSHLSIIFFTSTSTMSLMSYFNGYSRTVIMALTVGLDSWYYGEMVVVPWRFLHFNVVTGLSSHYGTFPWHWYLSQGLPATLTTHLLPLILAVVLQPYRHKDLLPVILWSLLVYRCVYGGVGVKDCIVCVFN